MRSLSSLRKMRSVHFTQSRGLMWHQWHSLVPHVGFCSDSRAPPQQIRTELSDPHSANFCRAGRKYEMDKMGKISKLQ